MTQQVTQPQSQESSVPQADNFWAMPPEGIKVSSAQLYPDSAVPTEEVEESPEVEALQDTQETQDAPEVNVDELLAALPDEPEEGEPVDTTAFDAQFKARFGITPEEASTVVAQFQEFQTKSAILEQKLTLASEWGVSFEEAGTRLEKVKKVWDKLPPDAQSKLDNVDGALTLWAYVEGKKNPNLSTPKTVAKVTTKPYDFTMSEIRAMDSKTYQARNAEITKAFNTGRVALNK